MSKNPNLDRDVQEQKHEKQTKQQHPRQGEAMGQKTHKPTVQFDKGQKFTSDEDIIRKSA